MSSQKIANLRRAQENLERALADPIVKDRDLGGIIKAFECAYELSWTALKRTLVAKGHDAQGARDVFRTAWQLGMLPGNDAVWFEMIRQRNLTVHTYDQSFAAQMVEVIRESYCPLLGELVERISRWGTDG
jgi:nucleotidyltransferase substrate binding protein (TIGR01987 family)